MDRRLIVVALATISLTAVAVWLRPPRTVASSMVIEATGEYFPDISRVDSSSCFPLESESVELEGRLMRQTFAGAPNYESIADGDEALTYWVLILEEPICGSGGEHAEVETTPTRAIQLILNPIMYRSHGHLLDGRVRVRGNLVEQVAARHFTPVLLQVAEITPANLSTQHPRA
jgi:hypothetical protein